MPCWVAKKLRPLPVHSCVVISVVRGSRFRSRSVTVIGSVEVRGERRPSPYTFKAYDAASIVGVTVWLRTKSRDGGVR